ncbi:MAG: hypothetical protein EOP15_21085 [Pseudomonas sp.]|nr:MAG: hypothetical protein EOP15_21085 [Pseudomonas sp.]
MKRMTPIRATALLAGLLAFAACRKEADTSLSYDQQLRRGWLTDTTWTFEWAALDLDRDGDADQYIQPGTMADCVFDNAYTFLPNGSGDAYDSTHRCDTNVAVHTPFAWSLADNDQTLTVTGSKLFGIGGRLRINYLDNRVLTVSRDTLVPDPLVAQPITASLIISMKH